MRLKNFYIDDDQAAWLEAQPQKASEVVRNAIRAAMNAQKPRTLEEKKKELARIEATIAYQKRLEDIENGRHITDTKETA